MVGLDANGNVTFVPRSPPPPQGADFANPSGAKGKGKARTVTPGGAVSEGRSGDVEPRAPASAGPIGELFSSQAVKPTLFLSQPIKPSLSSQSAFSFSSPAFKPQIPHHFLVLAARPHLAVEIPLPPHVRSHDHFLLHTLFSPIFSPPFFCAVLDDPFPIPEEIQETTVFSCIRVGVRAPSVPLWGARGKSRVCRFQFSAVIQPRSVWPPLCSPLPTSF